MCHQSGSNQIWSIGCKQQLCLGPLELVAAIKKGILAEVLEDTKGKRPSKHKRTFSHINSKRPRQRAQGHIGPQQMES